MTCYTGLPQIAWTLLFVALALPASAATLRVPSEYPDLRAAVNAAASGDEILVADGVYLADDWDIYISGKSLVISSENGPDHTILDGEGTAERFAFVVTVPATGVFEFRGLSFTGFYGADGSALVIRGPGECVIADCRFSRNYNAGLGGGAVHLTSGVDCLITDCTFVSNSGGVFSNGGSNAIIDRCSFLNGSSAVRSIGGSTTNLSRSLLAGNSQGAVATGGSGELVIEQCVIVNNQGEAAIYSASPTRIDRCTIARNEGHWTLGRAGGIRVVAGSLTVTSTILRNNCSTGEFADLVVDGGTATLTCCDIDSAGIDGWDQIIFDGDQVWDDPMFCDPLPCGYVNDSDFETRYSLDANSPSAAWRSPCGLTIGALDVGCGSVHLGACCLEDETCVITPPEECAVLQGEYLGDDSTCETDSCTATPVLDTSWGSIKANFR